MQLELPNALHHQIAGQDKLPIRRNRNPHDKSASAADYFKFLPVGQDAVDPPGLAAGIECAVRASGNALGVVETFDECCHAFN